LSVGLSDVKPLIDHYTKLLKNLFGDKLVSVVVFGSVVRNEAKADSDIDVLIVAEDLPEDIGSRYKLTSKLRRELRKSRVYRELMERNMPRLISEIILTPEEVSRHPPILLDITVEGKILYDKGGFLKRELEEIRKRLRELGARRVKGKRGWYWILKPDIKFGEVIEI